MKEDIQKILDLSTDRFSFCSHFINYANCQNVAELGVYKGDFAENMLKNCVQISKYTMIDPWRNLEGWNKPANKDDIKFEAYYQETLRKTEFAENKREILRGKTTEIIDTLTDQSYDIIYIDGDHTLRGISIDLILLWKKIKSDGYIMGDDFSPTIWQHSIKYEPTMVFPFAVYFAEAMNCKIYGLPFNQFLIAKGERGFEFIDFTKGKYSNTELRHQLTVLRFSHIKNMVKMNLKKIKRILKGDKT